MKRALSRLKSATLSLLILAGGVGPIVLSTAPVSASTAQLTPVLDTQIRQAHPNSTYEHSAVIYSSDNEYDGLFRFDASSMLAGNDVTSVTFSPYINYVQNGPQTLTVYAVSGDWVGTSSWNSTTSLRTGCIGTPLASLTVSQRQTRVSLPLPTSIVAPDGSVNLCTSTTSSNGQVRIASMEAADTPPYLDITTQPSQSTAADTTPPSVPQNLTGDLSATAVNLSWSASIDDTAVAGYQILRDGHVIATSADATFTDTTVVAGTTYQYAVTAFDGAGNTSAPSAVLTMAMPAAPSLPAASTILSLADPSLTDASSWAVSNVTSGVRWTNQDRTHQSPDAYAIGPNGQTVATVTMTGPGVTNIDSESDATNVIDGVPYVYVADAGGNLDARNEIYVHRFVEPALDVTKPGQNMTAAADSWTFTYPSGDLVADRSAGPDCEALLINPKTGQMFFLLKSYLGLSDQTGGWGVYAAPAGSANTPGTYNLTKITSIDMPLTDATWSMDGTEIALRTYDTAYVYKIQNGDVAAALANTPLTIATTSMQQSEGIAFSADGQALEFSTEDHNSTPAPVVRQPLPADYQVAPVTLVPSQEQPPVTSPPVVNPPAAQLNITNLGNATISSTASRYTTANVTPSGGVILLYVIAGRTDGTAGLPTTVSGLGTDWQLVKSMAVGSGNLQTAVYRSTGPTNSGAVTVSYASNQQHFTWQLIDTGSAAATVVQAAADTTSSTTPSVEFAQPVAMGDMLLSFLATNSSSQTTTVANNATQLGNKLVNRSPSLQQLAELQAGANQQSASFAAAGRVQKAIIGLDIGAGTASTSQPTSSGQTVAVIGDSLTYQDGYGTQNITNLLAQNGYPVGSSYVYGVGGKSITQPDTQGMTTAQNIAAARAQLGHVDTWLIALGTNDTGLDDQSFINSVTSIMNAIGPNDTVVWVGLGYYGVNNTNAAHFNPIMASILNNYANAHFADWNSYIHNGRDETGLWVYPVDSTHMTQAGYAIRNQFYVDQILLANQ